MPSHYEVIVELKPEVLDTTGRAVQEALRRLQVNGLQTVKVSRRYLLEIDQDQPDPELFVQKLAKEILSNPVSELCSIRKLSDA